MASVSSVDHNELMEPVGSKHEAAAFTVNRESLGESVIGYTDMSREPSTMKTTSVAEAVTGRSTKMSKQE